MFGMDVANQTVAVRVADLGAEVWKLRVEGTSSQGGAMIDFLRTADATSQPADRIVTTPDICGGDWRIAGTRVPVRILARYRELGASDEELLSDYPFLSAEDLAAAWAFIAKNPDAMIER